MVNLRWQGIPITLALFITSFLGPVAILFPFSPLVFFRPKLWRACVDRSVGYWLSFPIAILELFHGTKFRVSGDAVLAEHPGLMIMNHRTRLDWMFFWSALYKMDPWLLHSEKISLKQELRRVPGVGWGMECCNYIFLERTWARDKDNLTRSIQYYRDMERPYQLLLFPEGTDLCPKSRARMEKYAGESGLPVLRHVLHPRTTGLCHIVRTMRENDYLEYVYDVICAYGDEIVQTEVDFAMGHCSKDVQFHVDRYPVSEIPTEDEALVAWVRGIWALKESILGDFYGRAPAERDLAASVGRFREARAALGVAGQAESRIWPSEYSGQDRLRLCCSLVFWTSAGLAWLVFFFRLSSLKVYLVLVIANFVGVQHFCGGMDKLAMRVWFDRKALRLRAE